MVTYVYRYKTVYLCGGRQAPKRTLTKMTVRRRQDEMLWRHSSQPIRQPLLKKLLLKEPQSEQAIQCYLDIFYVPYS